VGIKRRKDFTPGFAVCIDNSEHPVSLELHKLYWVLPDDDAALDGDLRIIDESGEDYLYPARCFVLVDLPRDEERIVTDSFSRSLQRIAA